MSNKPIGELKRVELREIWKHEERDFSQWLKKPENLSLLGDELGIEISADEDKIKTEARVGKFSVDILAHDEGSDQKIIIENQLKKTNHDHLGKIITYAAGYDAAIVIWIFKDIEEEHRRAIDWLNDNTSEEVSFFAVKIEAWKIGDSLPAPKFQIVSKPNEWAKMMKVTDKKLGETRQKQLRFWSDLKEAANEKGFAMFRRKPQPSYWYSITRGFQRACWITLSMRTHKRKLNCRICIRHNEKLFDYLENQKVEIEKEIGASLEWADKKNVIEQSREDFDLDDESKRDEYFNWLIERAGVFHDVFKKHIECYKEQNKAGGNI